METEELLSKYLPKGATLYGVLVPGTALALKVLVINDGRIENVSGLVCAIRKQTPTKDGSVGRTADIHTLAIELSHKLYGEPYAIKELGYENDTA